MGGTVGASRFFDPAWLMNYVELASGEILI